MFSKNKRKHSVEKGHERSVKQRQDDIYSGPIWDNLNKTPPHSSLTSDGYEKAQKSRKIVNLIYALNEILEGDGMDGIKELIGEEAITTCLDLRSSLKNSKCQFEANAVDTTLISQIQSHDLLNVPQTLSPFSITRWRSSTIPNIIPQLPKILDPTLEKATFVHTSHTGGRITDVNYEQLEFIGDAYMELIATLLISQTFPSHTPGKQSQLRERIVKNVTLAEYSQKYKFDRRLEVDISTNIGVKAGKKIKLLGDVFEAYVAAVVLSDPANGLRKVSDWLKDLWGMTLAAEIIQEELSGIKIDSPLWRLRGKIEFEKIPITTAPVMLSHKEQLQKMIGSKYAKLSYKDTAPVGKDPSNKLPIFTVSVFLDGWGENDKLLGTGKAHGKKEAGNKAAEMALAKTKLIKTYAEQKKIFDAQTKLETEALGSQGLT